MSTTRKLTLLLLATIVFFTGCLRETKPTQRAATLDPVAHKTEIQKWQSERLASLTKDDGWLTLVGLFWLNEGENKFGSDEKNAVVLPKDKAPSDAGSFWLEKGHVRLVARPEAKIFLAGRSDIDVKYDTNTKPLTALDLRDDNDDNGPTMLKLGSLLINVIKRGERIGVRVKDTESQTRSEFKGLEYYPIDPKWRLEARFEPYQPAKTIPITNVLGMTDDEISPGALIRAIVSPIGCAWFFIFLALG